MTTLALVLAAAVGAPVPKDEKAEREFREKIDTARDKAAKYLKDKQGKDGGWEGEVPGNLLGFKGGATALAALGLLEAGADPKDPAVVKAAEYLAALKPEKTYVVSLQTQVLARADAKKYAKEIQTNADWLLEKAVRKEKKLHGWSYPANEISDNSNTHFAVMGLHAAAQAGAKVDADVWPQVRGYYAATQTANGGWTYHHAGDTNVSHSMTVAALLGLTIATKYDKQAKNPDPAFEKGMKLLLSGKLGELGQGKSTFIGWLTTTELGRALGTTEFRADKQVKAWYREGVEKMLKAQQADGSFEVRGGAAIDAGQPVLTTACGLYLLGPPGGAKK